MKSDATSEVLKACNLNTESISNKQSQRTTPLGLFIRGLGLFLLG